MYLLTYFYLHTYWLVFASVFNSALQHFSLSKLRDSERVKIVVRQLNQRRAGNRMRRKGCAVFRHVERLQPTDDVIAAPSAHWSVDRRRPWTGSGSSWSRSKRNRLGRDVVVETGRRWRKIGGESGSSRVLLANLTSCYITSWSKTKQSW